ncbi:hypothetical protein RB195_013883 [Necator americanus]|uniref:Uncharacterized protein n=1 Tax=Necator americanus TaxID=51031 RepID=A0ABR1DY60_NECAM
MQALLILALITTCCGAGTRVNREVREPQQFVLAATYPPQRIVGDTISNERSFRARSRVFRNVQVQVDDEPRLYRASGRFQKRVVAAAPIHDITNVAVAKDSPPVAPPVSFNYDEGNHHLNKMTEDNSIMEEAAEYAKGLERTTVAVRGDHDLVYTTVAPNVSLQNVPAIIKPRTEEKKFKQPPPAFTQQPALIRPQANTFTSTVVAQTTSALPGFGANNNIPTPPNNLQGPYQQNTLAQVSVAPMIPLSLPPPSNPQVLPGLVPPQLPPPLQQGIPQVPGAPPIPGPLNPPTPPLGAIPQITPGAHFPQVHPGQAASVHGQHLSGGPPPTPQTPSLPPQQSLPGQVPHTQVPQLTLPNRAAPPPAAFPERVEIINGQAANSSLEQLGCGFDWLTNTCKDVFAIGWCGQCHDFGNIFVHDCKCVRPLIVLPPRQQTRPAFFSMI